MIYLIDGTLDGIFTAVFNSYLTKKFPTALSSGEIQLEIGGEIIEILTDKDKADRVFSKLNFIIPKREIERIYIAIKSGDPAKHTVIFNYLVKTFNAKRCIYDKLNDVDVFNFNRLVSQVQLEAHRFKGFLRFSKMENGVYYAKYYPDSDINALLLPHFISRYNKMPFIIHDLNHDVISAHADGKTKTVRKKINCLYVEDEFKKLFKTYYDSIFIKERKNERAMKTFMPKRYHKHLPEKDELL